MIECEFHSKKDSTIKPSNRIQCESIQRQIQPLNPEIGFNVNVHSKTDSTIKPSNRIQ